MWFLYGLVAAWLAALAGALWFAWDFGSGLGSASPAEAEPPVTIIVAVKGAGPNLEAFLASLRAFSYSDYRILAVVESQVDPAWPHLDAASRREGPPLSVEIAGLSEREGQKVHNLRHGLARLDERTRIVAFLDADTLPAADWLTRLVGPLLRDPDIAAVTGHRWIVPDDARLPSAVVAAGNFSIVTLPRLWSVCWGGTIAMRRETILSTGLADRMRGAVVDDVLVTRILHEAGLRIFTPRGLVVVSPARHDWRSAFAFATRQYKFVLWYLPASWTAALLLLTLPVLGFSTATALAISGDRFAIAALVVAAAGGQVRVAFRARIARGLFGEEGERLYAMQRPVDRWLAPLWLGFHALCSWSVAGSRRLWWAGILYDVRGRNDVRVITRLT